MLLSLIVIMIVWLIVSNHLPPERGNAKLSTEIHNTKAPSVTNTIVQKIEINNATFSLLESDSVIAPYTKAILNYREKLGGFLSKRQLLEIKDLDTSTYTSICNYISIDSSKIHVLGLNTSTIKELSKHPYLGYYLAQAIVNYREQHGAYKTIRDLLKNAAIDNATYARIAPYLSVN